MKYLFIFILCFLTLSLLNKIFETDDRHKMRYGFQNANYNKNDLGIPKYLFVILLIATLITIFTL
jgi:hypothetical protein